MRRVPCCGNSFFALRITKFVFQSVWMQPGTNVSTPKGTEGFRRGWISSKANPRQTAHTTWAYIQAWQRAAGCTMGPTRVAHLRYSTTITDDAWGTCERSAVQDTHQGFPRRALLAAQKGECPTSKLRPIELPRLARPKGCFASYCARSIDGPSGRTTGQLGYVRPH